MTNTKGAHNVANEENLKPFTSDQSREKWAQGWNSKRKSKKRKKR